MHVQAVLASSISELSFEVLRQRRGTTSRR